MFSVVSWKQYLSVCFILGFVYYLFIAWKYYRHEIIAFLKKLRAGRKNDQDNKFTREGAGEQFVVAETIKQGILELFLSLPADIIRPQEMIDYIKSNLPDLHLLSDKGLQKAIDNFFIQHMVQRSGIPEEDLGQSLWK